MLGWLAWFAVGGMLLSTTEPSAAKALVDSVGELGSPALTIRKQVGEVHVSFTVEDRRKRLVMGVSRDEISLSTDGQAVQTLTSFGQNSDLPLRLALLVDCSDSMRKSFAKERRAAQDFAERLLRPDIDKLLLVDFAGQSSITDLSDSPRLLRTKIKSLTAAGHTALYDAIYEVSTGPMMNGREVQPARRIMIVLSDGDDDDSRHGRAEAIEMAQRAGIVMYAISAHSSRYIYQGDAILRRMAEATGGRAFVLSSFDQIDKVFAEIEAELRTQYSLTFRPLAAEQCGFHHLEIRYRDKKMRVRSRQGYYYCEPAP
jgi:Ca-activated chloride channel family protein